MHIQAPGHNLDQLGDHGCGRKRNIIQRNQLLHFETATVLSDRQLPRVNRKWHRNCLQPRINSDSQTGTSPKSLSGQPPKQQQNSMRICRKRTLAEKYDQHRPILALFPEPKEAADFAIPPPVIKHGNRKFMNICHLLLTFQV